MLRSGWSQFPPYRVPSWHSIFALQAKPVGHHPRSFMSHAEGVVVILLNNLIGSGTVGYINLTIGIQISKRYPCVTQVIFYTKLSTVGGCGGTCIGIKKPAFTVVNGFNPPVDTARTVVFDTCSIMLDIVCSCTRFYCFCQFLSCCCINEFYAS